MEKKHGLHKRTIIRVEMMKRNVIYIFILVFLIGVVVNYLYREIMGLATNLMGILIFNAVGLGSVWLYFTIKNKIIM